MSIRWGLAVCWLFVVPGSSLAETPADRAFADSISTHAAYEQQLGPIDVVVSVRRDAELETALRVRRRPGDDLVRVDALSSPRNPDSFSQTYCRGSSEKYLVDWLSRGGRGSLTRFRLGDRTVPAGRLIPFSIFAVPLGGYPGSSLRLPPEEVYSRLQSSNEIERLEEDPAILRFISKGLGQEIGTFEFRLPEVVVTRQATTFAGGLEGIAEYDTIAGRLVPVRCTSESFTLASVDAKQRKVRRSVQFDWLAFDDDVPAESFELAGLGLSGDMRIVNDQSDRPIIEGDYRSVRGVAFDAEDGSWSRGLVLGLALLVVAAAVGTVAVKFLQDRWRSA